MSRSVDVLKFELKEASGSNKTVKSMRLKYGTEDGRPVKFDAAKLLKKVDEVAKIAEERDAWRKDHVQKVNDNFKRLQEVLPSLKLSQQYAGEDGVINVIGDSFTYYNSSLEMFVNISRDPYIVDVELGCLEVWQLQRVIYFALL